MLPVVEHVIDDKPEHIVIREERDQMPEDNAWGFKLRVPVHKFNLGELHNLSIQRGTLTDEERYIINDHIVQTIIMLESLPFPRHLRNVPEIAGDQPASGRAWKCGPQVGSVGSVGRMPSDVAGTKPKRG